MSAFDDDRPRPQPLHEIGSSLSLLSADELSARIELLRKEIQRLEAERQSKLSSKAAAESIFRS